MQELFVFLDPAGLPVYNTQLAHCHAQLPLCSMSVIVIDLCIGHCYLCFDNVTQLTQHQKLDLLLHVEAFCRP